MLAPALLALALVSAAAPKDVAARESVLKLARRMEKAAARTKDHTATFYKSEVIGGSMQPAEHIELKWRRPGHVYMKWLAGKKKGRELLWKDERVMKVKNGLITLDLDPDGFMARRESRHTVREAGLPYIVDVIVRDLDRAKAARHEGVRYEDLGPKNVHGALARCWRVELPKEREPAYYAKRSEICMDVATGLPSLVRVWDLVDAQVVLVEDYSYGDIRVNTGLTDEDFSTENPAYGF